MPWWYAVIESRHELQNPTSPEKIRLLGKYLGLAPGSQVLDLASGRGGPALILAETFGCAVTCVERAAEFAEAARERVGEARLEELVEVVQADAREFRPQPGRYDAALCLGASFVWGGLGGTIAALRAATRPDGSVAVGEPYWRRWPLPEKFETDPDEDFVSLAETVARFEAGGTALVGLIASTHGEWDRYESLHWLALEDWLHEHPNDPEAAEFRRLGRHHRDRYLGWTRDLLGWAIFVGRRR